MAPVQFHDLPVVHQGAKGLAQFLPPHGIHIESLRDVGQGERLAFSSPNDAQDFFGGKGGGETFFLR